MNPQIIIGAIAILTFFKDSIAGAFKGENGKTLKIALVGVGVFYLYNRSKKSEKKEELNNDLPNSIPGGLAQRLYNAFHPYYDVKIPFLGHLPDGTDEAAVKQIAAEIGKANNYSEVSEAYNTLHSSTLVNDLNSEGVYESFMNAYNQASYKSTTPASIPAPVSPVNTSIQIGDTVKAVKGWNIRKNITPYSVVKTAKGGESFKVLNILKNFTAGGTKGTWLQVQDTNAPFWNFEYNLIMMSGVTK